MEVKFGPSKKKGENERCVIFRPLKCLICLAYLHPFSLNFYLFHLSLMPEYLRVDLEFRDIEPTLPFDYNFEHVINDFILPAVFVGNDFLPHLQGLHIHENGLEWLFDVYRKFCFL
jgi:5'-3' exonuclease